MTDLSDRPPTGAGLPPEARPTLRPRAAAGAPPAIDPRIARRWIDARREEGRRRLRLLVGAGSVAAAAGLAALSLWTPLFEVRHVRVSVTGAVAPATVRSLAGLDRSTQMIDVDPAAIRSRLDADPQLGGAVVERQWPTTVTISVAVRTPVAAVPVPGAVPARWAEVDETGRVLTEVTSTPYGLPLLLGTGPVPAVGSWVAGSSGPSVRPGTAPAAMVDMQAAADGPDVPAGAAAALAVVASMPPQLRPDLVSVTAGSSTAGSGAGPGLVIEPPRRATGTVSVGLGDGSQLAAKVTALTTLLDQTDLGGVTSVDLSVPSRPAETTTGSGGGPAAG